MSGTGMNTVNTDPPRKAPAIVAGFAEAASPPR